MVSKIWDWNSTSAKLSCETKFFSFQLQVENRWLNYHTHTHNWLLQPYSQYYWLYVLIWHISGGTYDSEQQIFWETFNGNFIDPPNFCQKCSERKSTKKYFLVFYFNVWPMARTLALRLISFCHSHVSFFKRRLWST